MKTYKWLCKNCNKTYEIPDIDDYGLKTIKSYCPKCKKRLWKLNGKSNKFNRRK